MSESIHSNAESVERVFLWQDAEALFRSHADSIGIQLFDRQPHVNMVLVSKPYDGYEDYTYSLCLWGKWISGSGVTEITLIYADSDTGLEHYSYNLSPALIREYALNGAIPTDLSADDLQDMRADLSEVVWDAELSQAWARNSLFFD